MGHTKWPFRVEIIERECTNDYAIVDANGKRVADTLGSDFGVDRENNLNALLIVACVNACAGIADPSAIPEAIAVLEWLVAFYHRYGGENCMATPAKYRDAVAVLEKLKGGA